MLHLGKTCVDQLAIVFQVQIIEFNQPFVKGCCSKAILRCGVAQMECYTNKHNLHMYHVGWQPLPSDALVEVNNQGSELSLPYIPPTPAPSRLIVPSRCVRFASSH